MTPPRRVPIRLPELGVPARFSLGLVRPGERVFEGDRVAEVLVPGATFDISAPATGWLAEWCVGGQDSLTAGQVLGTIFEDD